MQRLFLAFGFALFAWLGSAAPVVISNNSAGDPADGGNPRLSADGSIIAFTSNDRLLPEDTNSVPDLYVLEIPSGTLERVSVSESGQQALNGSVILTDMSPDGRYIVYLTDSPQLNISGGVGRHPVWVDRQTGERRVVAKTLSGFPDAGVSEAVLSADGQRVVYVSNASNLAENAPNDASNDLYLIDFATDTTSIISVDESGTARTSLFEFFFEASISDDGKYVAFASSQPLVADDTNDFIDVYVRDLDAGVTRLVSASTDGALGDRQSWKPSISADAQAIVFSTASRTFDVGVDTDASEDIFIHERLTGVTRRISESPVSESDAVISRGQFIAWENDISEVRVSEVGRVSVLDAGVNPAISDDGACVAYQAAPGAPRYIFLNCLAASPLVASILPSSRSVQTGQLASAFVTIINGGTQALDNCQIAPGVALDATFTYQITDPATNALLGAPNTPVAIAAGAAQSFFIGLTPQSAIAPTDLQLAFFCGDETRPAAPLSGLNTLLVSASDDPVPDIVALASTPSGDGAVHLAGGVGAFAVATVNVGASAEIEVRARATNSTLGVTVAICQTDATAACVNPPLPSTDPVIAQINANETSTFSLFPASPGGIAADPATNRVVVEFRDTAEGIVRGASSVAVDSQ